MGDDTELAGLVTSLTGAAVVGNAIATGQPISYSQATLGGVIGTGGAASIASILPVLLVVGIALVAYFAVK